jgi:hypothetical protein
VAGSLDKRIEALEKLYADSADEERSEAEEAERELMFAILDEIAKLGACRSNRSYRGGIPVQPTDPTGNALGYPYTFGQRDEFAARRVIERLGLSSDESEELITTWGARLRALNEYTGGRWDEVAVEGPPEPTPPMWG